MKKQIILPGYGRSGTLSYREFFEGHPDINVLSNDPMVTLGVLFKRLDEKYKNIVISEPRLSIDPQHSEVWADMFQRYMPNAKIIFTRRNPLDNLQAWYSVQFKTKHIRYVPSFKEFLGAQWRNRSGSFLGSLHRKNSIDHYTKRFNDVAIYEMVPDLSSGSAFRRICNYLGVPWIDVPLTMKHNRRSNRIKTYEILRGFVPFSCGGWVRDRLLSGYLSKGKRLNPKWPKGWKARLEEYYEEN